MNKIRSVTSYIHERYPLQHSQEDITDERLMLMVYLSDWRCAIMEGETITNVTWKVGGDGVYNENVIKTIESYKHSKNKFDLSNKEKAALNHVLVSTWDLPFHDLLQLVYSTYPVMSYKQSDNLNLTSLAREYQEKEDKGAIYWVSGVKKYDGDYDHQFFNDKLQLTNEEIEKYGSGDVARALENKLDEWSHQEIGRGRQTTILYYKKI